MTRTRSGVDRGVWTTRLLANYLAHVTSASPEPPPPVNELMPEPLLRDELPEDLPWLLRQPLRADLYLQDAVEIALRPTLARAWCPKGRRIGSPFADADPSDDLERTRAA